MSTTPSDNPAERAMITTLRVWFTLPLSGAALLLLASLLKTKLGIFGGISQMCFFVLYVANAFLHVALLLLAARGSIVALSEKGSRYQGFIALVMVLLALLISIPMSLIFLSAMAQSS